MSDYIRGLEEALQIAQTTLIPIIFDPRVVIKPEDVDRDMANAIIRKIEARIEECKK